ncbi:hypothetical protein JZ751_028202 [Albula glossodonta]|uniref:Uncharacterized protein n=1 Tax=Albula glossodonta TaxID=121402 RepID=A0A8T2PAZ5_9TELE|nr:hypothetical protein JZ751_028202 [Albula glossodonta]
MASTLLIDGSCQGCEWRWQKERAEIGSRWTWLQVRVSELELQIQWLNDLQQQINSTKGGVVLAETQPLTNKQGQQVLLLDTTDCDTPSDSHDFTSDLELEPSSPTQLLRNIERQGDPLFPGQVGLKRRRVCRRRQKLPQLDSTCVSARTRPLLTYHKPRLFTLDPLTCPRRQQGLEPKPSCNPPVTYAHPSHRTKTRRRETPLPVLLQSTLFREDWVPQVAPVKTEELSPYCCTNFDNKEACFPALNKWSVQGASWEEIQEGLRGRATGQVDFCC